MIALTSSLSGPPPWKTAIIAKTWLSGQLPAAPDARSEALRAATERARSVAAQANAQNEISRAAREVEIGAELKKIRAALRRLATLEREDAPSATFLDKDGGLGSVPTWRNNMPEWKQRLRQPYWSKLPGVVDALDRFIDDFQANALPRVKRTRGQRAKGDVSNANTRALKEFFEVATGRAARPADLAILEIAFRMEKPCTDVDDFTARTKRWSKALRPK